jgi:cytidine deaminase
MPWKEAIENNFIVQHQYGEHGNWPGSTIVLSTVKIYATAEVDPVIYKWTRSNVMGRHAEKRFLDQLESTIKNQQVTRIEATLVQNYSPCSVCADALLEFRHKMQNKSIEFSLTIEFANVYLHTIPENRKGLRKLSSTNGIELKLLHDWEAFLESIKLTPVEKDTLLIMARSNGRQNNEKRGAEILDVILQEQGKQKQMKEHN